MVCAKGAVYAFALVNTNAEKGEAVEKAVKCAQGAEKTAENAVNEDRREDYAHHEDKLPCEQGSEHFKETAVYLVREKSYTALKSSCGADIFAEGGQGCCSEGVGNGNYENEEDEDNVFQSRKDTCYGAFFHLRGLKLVGEILKKSEGADPAADHSSEKNAVKSEDAENVEDRAFSALKGTLQRAYGAGAGGTGA